MTTPTRPYREAKKRWIIKAIRKHQHEIDWNIRHGFAPLNDLHHDFIVQLQAELDAREPRAMFRADHTWHKSGSPLMRHSTEPVVGPTGTAGDSGAAWPPPPSVYDPRGLVTNKW